MSDRSPVLPIAIFVLLLAFLVTFAYTLVISMSEETRRLIGIIIVIVPLVGFLVYFGIWIFRQQPTQINVVDAYDEPRRVQQSAPPAQLPPPAFENYQTRNYAPPRYSDAWKTVDVPRLNERGQAVPLAARVALRTQTGEGAPIAIPIDFLLRFAKLQTPSRKEWTGNREMYTQCAVWFVAQGFLRPNPVTNGYLWVDGYTSESRIEFLDQFASEDD